MTVRIGPSLAASALKRFCGTGWRFVVALNLLSFGLKRLQLTLLCFDTHVAVASNRHDLVIVKLKYWNYRGNQMCSYAKVIRVKEISYVVARKAEKINGILLNES